MMMIKPLADLPVMGAKAKAPATASSDDFATTLKEKTLPVAALPVADPEVNDKAGAEKDALADTEIHTPLPQEMTGLLIAPPMPPVVPVADVVPSPAEPESGELALTSAEPESGELTLTSAVTLQTRAAISTTIADGATPQGVMTSAGEMTRSLQGLQPKSADRTPDDATTPAAFFLPARKAPHQEVPSATDNRQSERLTEVNRAQPQKQPEAPPSLTAPEASAPIKKEFQPQQVQEAMPGPALASAVSHSPSSAAPAITASGVLEPQPDTPAWQHALGQQLTLFTRNGIHNAELRLHPEELGSLQIHLRLNNEQAQIHFVTANQQVKAALEAAMPHLRTLLDESGISLGQSSVGSDAASWGSFSQSQQGFDSSSGQGSAFSANTGQERDALDLRERVSEEPAQRMTLFTGVNTFV